MTEPTGEYYAARRVSLREDVVALAAVAYCRSMPQGTILIRRPKTLRDMARNYQVVIDGETVGTISRGAEESFTVQAGRHTVRCSIDWAGSRELTVEVALGETVELIVAPNGGLSSAWRQATSTPEDYLRLDRD